MCCKCYTQVLLKMRMSSRYKTTKELVNGHRMSSIILMKFIGALVKPKGMTNHSKKAFFGLEGKSSIHWFA
jgi:hypothetical protein